ncbi:MAG: DUF2116 family Zn-ribbon domain-containing protein [Clostridia bacterium]|nr:DUF2116 family Zn-ribbon domain-containing protein [Clostridia bacterium]
MEDHCIMCGEIIPEGLQVCPSCQRKYGVSTDNENRLMSALLESSRVPDPRIHHGKEGGV